MYDTLPAAERRPLSPFLQLRQRLGDLAAGSKEFETSSIDQHMFMLHFSEIPISKLNLHVAFKAQNTSELSERLLHELSRQGSAVLWSRPGSTSRWSRPQRTRMCHIEPPVSSNMAGKSPIYR